MTPEQVRARTRATYRAHGLAFDAQRPRKLIERPWLERLLSFTKPGDEILDLGCGAGEPVAAHLITQGRRVCGVDFAGPSLALARRRFPRHRWIEGDMRRLDLPHLFAGIVAWDSFFHLAPDEQARTLPLIARHLAPGGAFLVTVGPAASEALGAVNGAPVYHSSLAPEDYRARLEACGLRTEAFAPEDPDCDFHSVLLARR